VRRIVDSFEETHYGHTAIGGETLAALRQDWLAINAFVAEQEG
jgi:hypothetical protein